MRGEEYTLFSIDENGFAVVSNLPDLIGSEKQINWANQIRADRARFIASDFDNRFKAFLLAGKVTQEQKPQALAVWWNNHAAELTETSAAAWIATKGSK